VRTLAALLAAAGALATATPAEAGRFAVGLTRGAAPEQVAAALERATGGSVSADLLELGALTLTAPSVRGVARVPGVAYVERLDRKRRLAFVPGDPLVSRQWYLAKIRAFDAWAEPPPLAGPLVAVIDSGVDGEHPELREQVVAARSFVGGSPRVDEIGHGTFVAGIVAARQNGQGIAGVAWQAGLLVAKVVGTDRTIALEAEVRAIRWAVDRGARVINMSLGGIRNPRNPAEDTFSPLEEAAIRYAYGRGAVIVAAVGNADQAPRRPWAWANYPAALPHVIGVSAVARDGSVPSFSHRDPIYNDIAAPGTDMLSTIPRALTAARPQCLNQGYSDCGPEDFRRAEGTSFAAPLVTGAAALLLSVRPDLTADQVMALLTRTAVDAKASSGCKPCPPQRDHLTGWGILDVTAAITQALSGTIPPPDAMEPNDDAGAAARTLSGRRGTLRATVDYWDDQTDVYRIRLFPGQRLFVSLTGVPGTRVYLWRPGTRTLTSLAALAANSRVARFVQRGRSLRLGYRVPARRGGFYYLHVQQEAEGAGRYALSYAKLPPPRSS
jgi:subtilisin family serine protease